MPSFDCPCCFKKLRIPDGYAKDSARCPACKNTIPIVREPAPERGFEFVNPGPGGSADFDRGVSPNAYRPSKPRRRRALAGILGLTVFAGALVAAAFIGARVLFEDAGAARPTAAPKLGGGLFDAKASEFREKMNAFVLEAGGLVRAIEDRAIVKLLVDKLTAMQDSLSRVPDPPRGGEEMRAKAKRVSELLYDAVDQYKLHVHHQDEAYSRELLKKCQEGITSDLSSARRELAAIGAMLK
jgi:hypothetical protein